MKVKGFTLIELLAVIVILAIIALIATPIILGIIKDAKKESAKNGAHNYIDAIEQAVVRKNLKEIFNPRECTVTSEDGKILSCILINGETKEIKLDIDGLGPTNKPTIIFENGEVKKISNLTIQGETVLATSLKLTEYKNGPLCEASMHLTNGTGVLASEGDPYAYGVEYTCNLGDGDRTFYVLENINDNEIALILDRNIGEDVWWCGDEECKTDENWDNTKGPITAITYLNNLTSNWSNKVTVSLPTYNQIDAVIKEVGTTDYTYTCCGGAVFNNSYSNAFWLYDYLGQNNASSVLNPIDGMSGYWTLTFDGSRNNTAFYVNNEGLLKDNSIGIPYGVRPVIIISKNLITQQ